MVRIRARKDNGKLYFDFSYLGLRCRETTNYKETVANRKMLMRVAKDIDAKIQLNTFHR